MKKILLFIVFNFSFVATTLCRVAVETQGEKIAINEFTTPVKFRVDYNIMINGYYCILSIRTSDGGVLAYSIPDTNRVLLTKVSTTGQIEWESYLGKDSTRTLTGITEVSGIGYEVAGYVTLGTGFGKPLSRYAARLNYKGEVLWEWKARTGKNNVFYEPDPLLRCRNGSYCLIRSGGFNIYTDSMCPQMRWFDSSGVSLNEINYDSIYTGHIYATSFFQLADGGLGVLLYCRGNKTNTSFFQFWRLDSTGKRIWMKQLPEFHAETVNDAYSCAVPTQDGGFAIVTNKETAASHSIIIQKLDGNGNILFSKKHELYPENVATQVAETPSGDLLFAGICADFRSSASLPDDFLVFRTNATGKLLWKDKFGDSNSADAVHSLVVTGEHSFILGGYTNAGLEEFVTTAKGVIIKGSDNIASVVEGEQLSNINSFTLSPQPATEKATLTFTMESDVNIAIKITNLLGIDVISPIEYQTQTGVNTLHLPTDGLSNGVYIVSICSDKGITSQKLSIAH